MKFASPARRSRWPFLLTLAALGFLAYAAHSPQPAATAAGTLAGHALHAAYGLATFVHAL
ncbi:hypothetical protein [Candidatus Frankia alpina]|uniref:hypothetical protein n=1 Tax=Candidatus Frankia alpina TaxID=2699483 RepID=UPI0013D762ED|nr:hypothetical protein [Candidatus Frankia alpina]